MGGFFAKAQNDKGVAFFWIASLTLAMTGGGVRNDGVENVRKVSCCALTQDDKRGCVFLECFADARNDGWGSAE